MSTESAPRGRVVRRVFCDKATKQHVLATLRIEGDQRVVRLRGTVATGHGGMEERETVIAESEIAGYASYGVDVTCPCGQLFNIDLVRLFADEPVEKVRITQEAETGVSYDRRRDGRRGPAGNGGGPP